MFRLLRQRTQAFSHGPFQMKSFERSLRLFHSSSCRLNSALEEVQVKARSLQRASPGPKMQMEPYVKNLFLDIIDPDAFAFPEVDQGSLDIIEDMASETEKFLNSLKATPSSEKISTELINQLKELGVFKLNIPRQYGGMELPCKEILRLCEVFAKDPSLFHTLNVHLHFVSTLITSYASEEVKEKYLPALAAGDLQIGFALWEKDAGVDVSKLECSCEFTGDSYMISGTKQWVGNGGLADKFLVFARESRDASKDISDGITCLLVDKHAPGITAKSLDTLGVNGYHAWEITFDKTLVPKEDIIGGSGQGVFQLKSILHGKFTFAGAWTGLLKELLNTTLHHAINRETFGKPMIEHDIVKQHLGEVASRIYALESIAYMTAHFYDDFEDPECEVEAAIVKIYSAETLKFVVEKCLSVLGSDAYLKDKPYERILRDMYFTPLVETSSDALRMSTALSILQYVGGGYQQAVVERRNPLYFPKETLKRILFDGVHFFKDDADKGVVYENLHPSLEFGAAILQRSIRQVKREMEDTLSKWGAEIALKQMNLLRIADIAQDLYISTAVLARSSRSKSIGLRNCDFDMTIASGIVNDAGKRIEDNLQMLKLSPYGNNDANYSSIVKAMVHENKYFSSHPLSRNY